MGSVYAKRVTRHVVLYTICRRQCVNDISQPTLQDLTGLVSMASSRKLSSSDDYAEILNRYDTWLFDCDGVIWSGDDKIAGAGEAVDLLRRQGKRVLFVTNNASRSRKMLKKKFDRLGISASEVRRMHPDRDASPFCH